MNTQQHRSTRKQRTSSSTGKGRVRNRPAGDPSESRYCEILRHAPIGIFHATADGVLLEANPTLVELLGYGSVEELLSRQLRNDIFADPHEYEDLMHACRGSEHAVRREVQWKQQDGTLLWVELTVFFHDTTAGALPSLNGFVRDISREKEREADLDWTAELLRAIITSSSLAICVLDTEGRVLLVNPAYEQMFGWRLKELIGQEFPVVPPQAREEFQRLFERTMRGESCDAVGGDWQRRDGTLVGVSLYTAPLYDLQDSICGVVLTAIDVSDKRKAEEALLQSQRRYQELFENSLVANYVSTPEGKILQCNLAFARLYGFSSVEEVLQCHAGELYPTPQAREEFLNRLRRFKKLENYEYLSRHRDGRLLHTVENVYGRFNEEGTLVEIVGHIIDLTEQKMLEQQLLQAQKMESIGTLVSGIAHDYNNIFNNIIGFATQLKKYNTEPHRVWKYATTIERSASRGAELASRLLSFARKKEHIMEMVQVRELIEELASLAAETFPRTINVETSIDPHLQPVEGNKSELYQALLNICLNAADAIKQKAQTPNYGTIRIEARNRLEGIELNPHNHGENQGNDQWVEILVTDDGVGIPREILNRIFDPFFTTKRDGQGSGLGLTIAYSIVSHHKGFLTVESEVGSGTTVHLFLPVSKRHGDPDQPSLAQTRPLHGKRTVLLADDEVPMQEIGRELLEEQGYEVLVASDGREALELFRSNLDRIELVILDLVMPRLDGGQTYLEMRKIKPDVRTVFCTGYATEELIQSLLQEENLNVLRKPFHPTEFVHLVGKLMAEQSNPS
jgi:PAS domain S-box-containing protein